MVDVEDIHSTIISEISVALDLIAPLERVQVKDRRTPLYLTNKTCSAIFARDRAATRNSNHAEYRRLRNRAARLVKRDRLASNMDHLEAQGMDSKTIWNLANAVSGRSVRGHLLAELQEEGSSGTSRSVRGDAELADCVKNFYRDKIDKIRARIVAERFDDHQQQQLRRQQHQQQQQLRRQQQQQQQQRQQQQHFHFRAPNEREVLTAIMGLNNTFSLGVDGIPVPILKLRAPIIAAPAARLIRKYFNSAAVPSGFKKASVILLHKKNKPLHLPSSYRPVAILPAFSKVLERVVLQQVLGYLVPLLPPAQFGFRPT